MRPGRGDITTTRSDRNTASAIEWVTNSTVLRGLAGEVALAPDAQQLERHVVARHGVERAERLVHQQQRRVEQQGAAQRGALLHAARQLARQLVAEARRGPPCRGARRARLQARRRPCRRARPAAARSAGSSATSAAPAPGRPCRRRRSAARTARPATVTVPAVAGRSPATMRSRVDLPQPLGPDQRDELAGADAQRDAGERLDRAARRLVCHADPVEADQFPSHLDAGYCRASRPW